jgi:hypothetical protein
MSQPAQCALSTLSSDLMIPAIHCYLHAYPNGSPGLSMPHGHRYIGFTTVDRCALAWYLIRVHPYENETFTFTRLYDVVCAACCGV